jgi:DNA helicase HerA-like ATPase
VYIVGWFWLRLVGRVADGSTETHARLILLKDLERELAAEELVLIFNGGEKDPVNRVLGVLREGFGKNEFLSHTSYRPDVAYMKFGGEPSGAREVYSFSIMPIGVVTESGLESNRIIIQPRSPVYLLEDGDRPLEWVSKGSDVLWMDAYLEGHSGWRVPVDRTYIPYHVGVYGSTGSGKSWFTRYVLIPLYRRAGYGVLVLDWSGTDYAPYCENTVRIIDIALDEESILSYLEDKTLRFARNDNIRDAFDEFVERWSDRVNEARSRNPDRPEEVLYESLKNHVDQSIKQLDQRSRQAAQRAMRRVFRRIKSRDLIPIMGAATVEDILSKLREAEVVVIDMGGVLAEAKLGFFLALAKHLYGLMESGVNLDIALVIDEAPQYAPWEPEGIQAESTEMIKNLAALGRKRRLSLTLIAQGVKGEIGVNASVRRNLNTHFFGRIHPLDAGGEGGASEWLSPYGITADRLLLLKPGRFYFTGAMNPSPVPLLITYSPPSGV